MRKVVFISLLMLLLVTPVLAQAEPGSSGYDQATLEAVVTVIVNSFVGLILGAFGGSPAVLVVVGLLKKVEALASIDTKTLTFATALVVYALAGIASLTGYTPQFDSFLRVIEVAVPVIISLITALFGSKGLYVIARSASIPVIGDRRPEQMPVVRAR